MSSVITVPDEVSELLKEIIHTHGFSPYSRIDCGPGAEVGEGYNSKTLTVHVKDENNELHLFLKMQFGMNWHDSFDKMYANEVHFYTTIYPAYQEFLKEHDVENGFRNVPRCYGAKKDIVALENLGPKGYKNNKNAMDEEHIVLGLKTLAKFHAISFAFKDQKRKLHDTFVEGIQPCAAEIFKKGGFDKIIGAYIQNLLDSLNADEIDELSKRKIDLKQVLIDALFKIDEGRNKYSIITQGDCWSNNVLFSYDEKHPNIPTNIMLVDWQLVRYGSPAKDLGYFFYPIASESTMENYEHYMKVYYEELCGQIRQFGSDPEILYPFDVFKMEWKQFVKYGFVMGFLIIQALLMEKDEFPNLNEEPNAYDKNAIPKMKNEELFVARMRGILKHFIKYELL
ncbi:hypothetical protein Trydic_g11575 [Trypoxylus dichotomus]